MSKKKSRHRHIDDTPFLAMSKEGAQRAMDKTAKSTLVPMLDAARRGEDQDLHIAALMLSQPGKSDAIVYAVQEYGDEFGLDMVKDNLRLCGELGLLAPGEKLSVHLFVVREMSDVEATTRTTRPESADQPEFKPKKGK